MRVLVLDTIHGGKEIARALIEGGHRADCIDVYRGAEGIDPDSAKENGYDLIVAPVHLDPSYPLFREIPAPVVTHHQAVRWILGRDLPCPFVEVTGARGKTTTASALAHVMEGQGILHGSRGTFALPEGRVVGRMGITPASVIRAARMAQKTGGWCIAEVSLGFCGAGDLGILTSAEDYRFAAGKKSALDEKIRSGQHMPLVLAAPGVPCSGRMVTLDSIVDVRGDRCTYEYHGISGGFGNPLLALEAYRVPLSLAAAAACILGIDPAGLAGFAPLEGRMALCRHGDIAVIDDSNSGTCRSTSLAAISYARRVAGSDHPLTLVIGKEAGAVCEGFPPGEILAVIREARPDRVIIVGDEYREPLNGEVAETLFCRTLEEGKDLALRHAKSGSVVLAVKTWR